MRKCYFDSETCGLHGMPVLLQYAYDDGPIHLYDIWKRPVHETLTLVEEILECCLVGFNLSFDMFHLCKLYTTWQLLEPDFIPETNVRLVAEKEILARDGPCVKPASALDLMLHSRKGPFQCLMARDSTRIKRVPTILAGALAQELEKRVELDGIMFAKRRDPTAPKWQVYDRTNKNGDIDPDFKDVVLNFHPAGGLKFLSEYVLEHQPDFHFKDIECNVHPFIGETKKGYIPFALGVSKPEDDWQVFDKQGKLLGQAWPGIIHHHIKHWATNEEARRYAEDDVKYTRMLDEYFDFPKVGDDDSILACMVAAVRWHGFVIDVEKAKVLLDKARTVVATSPVNINKPKQVRQYIRACMDDTEALLIDQSTKKANIETIRDEMVITKEGEICIKCLGSGCLRCDNIGTMQLGPMPASRRASKILEIKAAAKEVELHAKLVEAGRFHASFNVIGTLSSRMSGGDGLNAQGIKRSKEVRRMFPLAWEGMTLCGGDFDSFEVVLADAVFGDPKLRRELLDGKKIHAMMGIELYPGKTYEEILATKDGNPDLYSRGKQAVFALLYGGDHHTIHNKLCVPIEVAETAFENFQKRFPDIKRKREEVFDKFQALKQPGGIGTAVMWTDPAPFSETFLGFRRFFTLENSIVKSLFDLARRPPRNWSKVKIKVVRTDRVQTAGGAVASALYGAAFQLQAANTRAANNHLIQSPGAQITKAVQRRIWDVQPSGVNEWRVAPMNVHDEVMVVMTPEVKEEVAEAVKETVVSYRNLVPLIAMDWGMDMRNWGDKDAEDVEKIKIFPNKEEFVDGQGTEDKLAEALDDQTIEGAGIAEWDEGLEDLASDEADLDPLFC
jgi:hypothetical protein